MTFDKFGFISDEQEKDFSQFGFEQEEIEEDKGLIGAQVEEGIRHVARSASRFAESIAGFPGDIIALADAASDFVLTKAGLPSGEEISERFEAATGRKSPLRYRVPTSHDFNKFANDISGGYLMPQSGGEEFADEIITDAALLMFGKKVPAQGGAISRTVKFVAKPFITSIGANVAKEAVEKSGGGLKTQTAAKLGTMFLIDLTGRKSARALSKELYKDAQSQLPEGASISAETLEKNLGKLEKKLAKGGTAPSKTPVQTKINEVRGKIREGKISIDELQEFKRDINEVSSSLYDLPKGAKAKLKSNFDNLRNSVKSTINEYGAENPEFLKTWNQAEEVHAALRQSSVVRNNVGKFIKQNPKDAAIVAGVFGYPLKAIGVKGVATVAAPAAVGLYGAELMSRIMKSPTLRKHYRSVVTNALKEEIPAMNKSLRALSKGLKKEGVEIPEEFEFEEIDF